ncbi:MAG: type II toxin-antitoxin system RelB/DinJ family antitoxin [Candidatus Parcubacteria bacterium]|nr:type II toxin-antitoxin system RelB/DinJ family antitoxin [Candidatus Parcubacteria bacterium]
MAKTMINIKTDREVKMNAKKLAQELGLSLSDVINASLRNFIRTREVRVSAVPHMTAELEKLLGSVEKDIHSKKNISRGFNKESEAINYLERL